MPSGGAWRSQPESESRPCSSQAYRADSQLSLDARCRLLLRQNSSHFTLRLFNWARLVRTRRVSTTSVALSCGSDVRPANLKHAREMILKAASGNGGEKPKPNLVVLPVSMLYYPRSLAHCLSCRNASTRHMVTHTSRSTLRPSATSQENRITSMRRQASR